MRTKRLYDSLRFKITAGLLFPLLAILAIFSYLQYASHRQLMMESMELAAANAGEIVEGSLQHAMLTNDFSMVQQIVDEIAKQPGVRNLFLLDKKGQVVISAGNRMVGTATDETEKGKNSYCLLPFAQLPILIQPRSLSKIADKKPKA